MKKWIAIALLAASSVQAEELCRGTRQLSAGIIVDFAVSAALPHGGSRAIPRPEYCLAEVSDGAMRRTLMVRPDAQFGFDVQITGNPAGARPFHVDVIPLRNGTTRTFQRAPAPVDVGPGDAVEFRLFTVEIDGGTMSVSERIVVRGAAAGKTKAIANPYFNSTAIPRPGVSVAVPSDSIRLYNPRVFRDGREVGSFLRSAVSGPIVWLQNPSIGRILLTRRADESFSVAAVVSGNRVEFQWQGVQYAVECSEPLLAGAGNLRARIEPAQPNLHENVIGARDR